MMSNYRKKIGFLDSFGWLSFIACIILAVGAILADYLCINGGTIFLWGRNIAFWFEPLAVFFLSISVIGIVGRVWSEKKIILSCYGAFSVGLLAEYVFLRSIYHVSIGVIMLFSVLVLTGLSLGFGVGLKLSKMRGLIK